MSQHVHLGAGKLGLAFPVAVSKKWGFTRTLILNRTGTDSLSVKRNSALRDNHRYFIKYFGSSDLQRINYDAFIEYEDRSVLSSTAIAAIANPDTVLVTTAVREANLERIAPLIAAGLASVGVTQRCTLWLLKTAGVAPRGYVKVFPNISRIEVHLIMRLLLSTAWLIKYVTISSSPMTVVS